MRQFFLISSHLTLNNTMRQHGHNLFLSPPFYYPDLPCQSTSAEASLTLYPSCANAYKLKFIPPPHKLSGKWPQALVHPDQVSPTNKLGEHVAMRLKAILRKQAARTDQRWYGQAHQPHTHHSTSMLWHAVTKNSLQVAANGLGSYPDSVVSIRP